MKKSVTILGSTGSIGTQCLELQPKLGFEVAGLAAHSNVELLLEQTAKFKPQFVAVVDEDAARVFSQKLTEISHKPKLLVGGQGLLELAGNKSAQVVLNAVVGIAGLGATLAALESGTDVALANKESLVTAGVLVKAAAAKSGAKLLPVDSEHSAIFQCLQGSNKSELKKIILTASGGPFFGYNKQELSAVTVEQALKHPTWNMGARVTIDSATLMNKGLEFIEAAMLFDVTPQQIEVLVHRQSIVHSMVEFCDNSVIAQLGVSDMRIPIQYALSYPNRVEGLSKPLNLLEVKTLTFEQPDFETFTCFNAMRTALEKGGLAACAGNAAGEVAVGLFLNNRINFNNIGEIVAKTVQWCPKYELFSLGDVYNCDKAAREFAFNAAGKGN